jgi:hypothetical protein
MELPSIDIAVILLIIVLMLIFIALPLYITARVLDEDEGFPKALLTTILLIVTFSLCVYVLSICLGFLVAVIVNLFIIRSVYETSWGKALVMWIVTIVMAVVIIIVIALIGVVTFAAVTGLT